jgi:RNA 2',3'-cyclic 3'-phosphodiesterase
MDEGRGQKIRTFIAIELPGEILEAIRELQDRLKAEKMNLRWVEPGSIHLTLKFLGEIHSQDIKDVSRALEKAAGQVQPFDLHSKGIGAFPGLNHPRVLWTGIGGDTESLSKLAGILECELATLGFEREPRPFKGHLTLARARERETVDPVRMTEVAGRFMHFKTKGFAVREVVIFKSSLKPGGPVYEKLFTVSLATPPKTK